MHTVKLDSAPDLLDGAVQDPRQLTSIVGLEKDLRAITSNLHKKGDKDKEPWWKRKLNQENVDNPANAQNADAAGKAAGKGKAKQGDG